MNCVKLHVSLFFILLWSFAFTQEYTNYTTKDGLPSNHVYKILQDNEGFVWFLTDKGMVKYNGNTMQTFTTKNGLPINDVWDAFVTSDSKIWFMAKSSKLGYIKKDSIHVFSAEDEERIMSPIFTSQVGDEIFPTGTENGYRLENNKWKKDIRGRYETKVHHKKIDYIRHSTNDSSINIYNKNFNIVKSFYVPIVNNSHTRRQLTDSLYFWVSDKRYAVLNLNTLSFKTYSFKNQIGIEKVKYARINIVNNEFQITGTGFVGFFDTEFNVKKPFFFPKRLGAHYALVDRKDNIWLATFSNGIYKLPNVKQHIKYSLENEKVGALNMLDDEIIAGVYNKGFYKYDTLTKKFNPFVKVEEFVFNATKIDSLNTSYFLTRNKIILIKNKNKKVVSYKADYGLMGYVASEFVYFKEDLIGRFSFGIHKIYPEALSIKKIYMHQGITDLLVLDDRLLIGSSRGVKEFRNDSILKIKFNGQLFHKPVLSLTKISDSNFLINTDGFGTYFTDFNKISLLEGTEFLTVQKAFVEQESKTVWLATTSGVLKYKYDKGAYTFDKIYDINNGLPSNNINDVIVIKDDLIVSTNQGIAIVPKAQQFLNQFEDIYIEKGTYGGKVIEKTKNSFTYKGESNATFTISSIDFSENKEKLSYQYQLMPIQKEWVTTNSITLHFSNLKPELYTLKVKKEQVFKEITFTITPLWYQMLWFRIAFIALGFIVFVLIVQWRRTKFQKKTRKKVEAQQKMVEQELYALRSQMNPHFVFNSLNSIQYYITKNEIDLSEKYLVKFARLIRMIFDFSSKKTITLNEEIKLLKGYLEIEKMRFGKDFKYQFLVDPKINLRTHIPSMLIQPIVENAVNHGIFHSNQKGLIVVTFDYIDSDSYKIIIQDDGVGIKKSKEIHAKSLKKHQSKSTVMIADRIRLINESKLWEITQETKYLSESEERGTVVTLTFKKNRDEY